MEQKRNARNVGTLAIALGVLLLSGCASNTPIENFSGVPLVPVAATGGGAGEVEAEEGEEAAEPELEEVEVAEGETSAFYLDYGDRLAVVMWGSSTCPPVGSRIVVLEDQHSGNSVRVDVEELPADAVCTADLVPHTTVFGTPENITTTQPLKIDVAGEEVVVPVK